MADGVTPQGGPIGGDAVPALSSVAFWLDDSNSIEEYTPEKHVGLHSAMQRAVTILGDFPYVSVELEQPDGSLKTLHITRSVDEPGRINIHLVSDAHNPDGSRYTSLEARVFLNPQTGTVNVQRSPDPKHALIETLRQADLFIRQREKKVHVVHVDTQGYHERMPRLVLGKLPDTGGQTKYAEEAGIEFARMGGVVTIVSRGGPNHPVNGDVRVGMHYKRDFVDLMFVCDDCQEFVRKEDMFPEYDLNTRDEHGNAVIKKAGIFDRLAREMLQHFDNRRVDALFGHYIDGAAVARSFWYLRRAVEQPVRANPVFVVHSLGMLKAQKLKGAGKPIPASLNIEARAETEWQVIHDSNMRIYVVSEEINESVMRDYRGKAHGFFPAGVDTNLFMPRLPDVKRRDSRYDAMRVKLARALRVSRGLPLPEVTDESGRTFDALSLDEKCRLLEEDIERLKQARLVIEVSRNIGSKGKDTVMTAFAEARKLYEKNEIILIMNIADLSDPQLQKPGNEEVKECATELHHLIDKLGIRESVIHCPSFSPAEVAELLQMGHVYLTGAVMETWGMSVQEAAACRIPIVSSNAVPLASGILRGGSTRTLSTQHPQGGELVLGKGVLLFDVEAGSDWAAAAEAVLWVLDDTDEGKARREKMTSYAYTEAIRFSWTNHVRESLEKLGFPFERLASGEWRILADS